MLFYVNPSSGKIYFKGSINYESQTSGLAVENAGQPNEAKFFLVKVRAKESDTGNTSGWKEIKVYVDDVNEAPNLWGMHGGIIDETIPGGSYVAELLAEDPENDAITFFFEVGAGQSDTSADGAFRIENNQIIRTNAPIQVAPNGESREYVIIVKDQHGATSRTTIWIDINDVGNLAPIASITDNTVREDIEPGAIVGTLSAIDPDLGDTAEGFDMFDDAGGLFTLGYSDGAWRVIATGPLDYDSNDPRLHRWIDPDTGVETRWYEISVTTIDNHNLTSEPQILRIYVTDVNEAPTATYTPVGGINVGTQPDTVAASIAIQDPDERPEFRDFHYQLVTDASGTTVYAGTDFRVDAGGNIVVNGALTAGTKTLWVRITDSTGPDANTIVQAVTFTIASGNAPPIIIVDDGGTTDWGPIPDTSTVQLFQNVSFQDDAGPDSNITVVISFDGNNGTLTSALGRPGIDYIYDPENDPYSFIVTGSINLVNQIIRQLTFNPKDQYVGSPNRTTDFTVNVFDEEGEATSQTLTVFVRDTPANVAPTLTIDDNAEHFVVSDNGQGSAGAVNPFIGLDLGDSENDVIVLTVTFRAANGTLGDVTSVPGVVDVWVSDPNAEFVAYSFKGRQSDLEAFLGSVTFDASNDSAAGGIVTTTFSFALTDGLHPLANAPEAVTVVTESSTNGRPVLFIAPDTRTTDATDDGMAVHPFRGVDLADAEDDDLVLTVAFRGAADQLQGTGSVTGVPNADGTVSFTFRGKASYLKEVLHYLSFNPENGSADNGAVDTVFTISVSDLSHLPVIDHVTVHTQNGDDTGNGWPSIDIFPGTETTDATSDGPVVYPFRGVDISDHENDVLVLTISFEAATGTLAGDNLPTAWTQTNGIRTYVLTGTADQLDAILQGLSFDPTDGLTGTDSITTAFTMTVQDATHTPAFGQVSVVTAPGGTGAANAAPSIDVAQGSETTWATDNGAAVYPFRGFDISDVDNDVLVLTIRVSDAAGELSGFNGWQVTSSLVNGIRTYTVSGYADSLDELLHNLSFNPTDDSAANAPTSVDTVFEISVQDATHEPVSKQVTVFTTHGTDPVPNAEPSVTFFPGTQVTAATDDGPAVAPFRGIDLTDTDGDTLIVKISFNGALGELTGYDANDPSVQVRTSGGIVTITFAGTADALDGILQVLLYNPAHYDPANPIDGLIGPHVFTISVQDQYHDPVITSATVNTADGGAEDVNHAPAVPGWSDDAVSKAIDETAVVGSEVGTLRVIDQDGDDVMVGFWYDNALHQVSQDNRFQIVGGVVKVLDASVDADIPDLPYLVRAVDSRGAFTETTIHIAITDTGSNQAPVVDGVNNGAGPAVTTIGFDESVLGGGFVAQIVAHDDGNPGDLVYFMDDQSGLFDIDQATGRIALRAGLDYEALAQHSWTVTVWTKDRNGQASGLESAHVDITLNLQDVNEAPTEVTFGAFTPLRVGDSDDMGLVLVGSNDPDVLNDQFRINHYKFLVNGNLSLTSADGLFEIDEVSGQVRLTRALVDTDANTTHTFRIVAYDAAHPELQAVSEVQTVTVSPAGTGTPLAPTLSNIFIDEMSDGGTLIGDLSSPGAVGFELTDPSGLFEIVGDVASGFKVALKQGVQLLDFEQSPNTFDISIKASDGTVLSEAATFTIAVVNQILEITAGSGGNDLIIAGNENDNLAGGLGDDTLYGGNGNDILQGGAGHDVFVFDTNPNTQTNKDTIRDFTVTGPSSDMIWLSKGVFAGLTASAIGGALDVSEFAIGSKAADRFDRIIYNKITGALWYDPDGSLFRPAIQIAQLSPQLNLTKDHFLIIP
ncbi:hypothetical protein [Microvirga lotononidis]|uniref:Cadherin domain-containing protein n=1 Tax=Microvirga lotononidis TaxID=864069 RepID=I4YP93_9HYPH|nr:hypothetical protein [Microvirga lotononidis]EIM25785.1 hypothetical protein MicloDRAFT_00065140 [Microvirga lotononidis]WQO25708.1 hypothetical protein U0023_13390 [Microvirga lotononidis]